MSKREVSHYRWLLKVRDSLKKIQQISWNINSMEKHFPLQLMDETTDEEYLKAYLDRSKELTDVYEEQKQLQEEIKKELGIEV